MDNSTIFRPFQVAVTREAFFTSWVGQDGDFNHLSKPHGPDTLAFQHVRQNAKYLSAIDLKERWKLVVGTLAGMLLNWTAPIFVVAAAACFLGLLWKRSSAPLEILEKVLAGATVVALILYGLNIRHGKRPGWALAGLALIQRGQSPLADCCSSSLGTRTVQNGFTAPL